MLAAHFKKKSKSKIQNTTLQSMTLEGNGSSVQLNVVEGHSSSDTTKNEELPARLVPGGKMPRDQGKKVFRHLGNLLFMLVVQVGIPLALYYGLRNRIGVVYALVISGIPPFLWVVVEFIRKRRVDTLGVIICLSFILSGVISIVSGDARAALIRDSAVSCVIGGFFLVTLLPIHTSWLVLRPLTYIIGEQMFSGIEYQWTDCDGNKRIQSIIAWRFEHVRFFRWNMRLQTFGWGVLLILEFVASLLFVEVTSMSVDDIVKYNNIINGAVIGVMTAISIAASSYESKIIMKVGQAWTLENDFTNKFQEQQHHQEQHESEQSLHHNNNDSYGSIPIGSSV